MGLMEDFALEAGVAMLRIGGVELVSRKDAEAMLQVAARHGASVLAIEGFRIIDGCVAPDMDAIADYSGYDHSLPEASVLSIEDTMKYYLSDLTSPELFLEFDFRTPKRSGTETEASLDET